MIILILIVLSLIIFSLLFLLMYVAKKATYISDVDKKLIKFTIDMYIDYAEELNIVSEEDHEKLISELERVREKYFSNFE